MKIGRLNINTSIQTTWMLFGFLLAFASALRLSALHHRCFGPSAELVPLRAIFLFGSCSAIACLISLCRRSAALRRLVLGITVAAISFAAGVLLTGAI